MFYMQDLFILGPAICLLTDSVIFGNFFLELRGRCGQTVTHWASKRVSQPRSKAPVSTMKFQNSLFLGS